MHTLYLGLGSNIGDRQALIRQALGLLDECLGRVEQVSGFIETEPWGFESENRFINAACRLCTYMSPMECLHITQQIERTLGRSEKSSDGIYRDRPIDIDLLMYDDLHLCTPELVLPHPRMHERDFVMRPLEEILVR